MTLLKAVNNNYSCLAAFNQGADAFCSIVRGDDYRAKYPIDQLFQLPGDGTIFQQDFSGSFIACDPTLQQVFLVRDGTLQLVAGTRGVAGFRDGPGDGALLGIGGQQGVAHAERMNSRGEGFFTDAKNNRIRKVVDPGDGGPWTVSTFASGIWTNSLLIDPQDRVLTVADKLYEWLPTGALSRSWPNPAGTSTITGMAMRSDGALILLTRNNAWDVLIAFNRDTGVSARVAGMTEPEVTAWMAAHGGQTPNDGALLGEAAFHSPGLTYFEPSGKFAFVGGGDVRGVRKLDFVTGRCSTLFCDGSWRETTIVLAAPQPNTNPDQPYYMTQPTGCTANGYSRQSQYNWIPTGSYRRVQDLELQDAPPSTLPMDSAFVSQAVPFAMVAGRQYAVTVAMKNTGTETWTAAQSYRLGSQNPQDNDLWGFGRVSLPDGASIATGQTFTFSFTVTAPAVGKHDFQWRMVRESVAWFGATTPNLQIDVQQGGSVAKPVVVTWVTQNETVPNADKADHFVVKLDALSADEPLTARTHTFLDVAAGAHSGSVACCDAAGNPLAPSVPFSVTVPTDPTAPIPVTVTVALG